MLPAASKLSVIWRTLSTSLPTNDVGGHSGDVDDKEKEEEDVVIVEEEDAVVAVVLLVVGVLLVSMTLLNDVQRRGADE